MNAIDHEHLSRCMAAMVDDQREVVRFVEAFGDRLRTVIAGILAGYGRHDLLRDPNEVDGLVWDVAFVLQARAAAWDPDHGVTPWTWAGAAVQAAVVAGIGHRTASLGSDELERALGAPVAGAFVAGDVDLDALGAREPLVAEWLVATRAVASERDATVHLEYQVQRVLGDPSPSHTVAAHHGVTAANVRQIDRRVRVKLEALVRSDPTACNLGRLPWLHPHGSAHSGSITCLHHVAA